MDEKKCNNDKNKQRSTSPDVKSRAVVKYTAVQVPVEFAKLRCNTDLNMPPSNWLSSAADSYGLRHAHSHTVGFSSFRLAHMFPDCVGDVDVVAGAECIKALLKLPYHPSGVISVIVHRIENTLLLDDFNILQYLMKPEWSWMKQFFYDNVIKSMTGKDKIMYIKNKTRFALQQKSLISKFLYHSLITSQGQYDNDSIQEIPSLPLPGPELPEPNVKENIPDPTFSNHTYNRNVLWTFEDIQMLIGSDMPIFGGEDRPCVSLRLRDATKPINVLTGIDYWLDNLMCNVPEVVMCYHLDGIVQKYEPIKTEELPNLEHSKFSPKVIRNVAQNILSFLKSNATKAGHTYWLFKGTHDDVVKLYDLTSLCGMTNNSSNNENPFTVPVAMLLYRVARNMKSPCQAGHIKMLLENCIKLLPIKKYPQIVASSHYMLSNLYVPANTNPGNPSFKESSSNECECGDPSTCRRRDEEEEDDVSFVKNKHETDCFENQDTEKNSKQMKENDNLFSKGVTVNSLKNPNVTIPENPPPPSVDGQVSERCVLALAHVKNGLNALKLLQNINKEKDKNCKLSEENEKFETDPKMAKPHEPIPMKYEVLNTKTVNSSEINLNEKKNIAIKSTNSCEIDKEYTEKSTKKKKKRKQSSELSENKIKEQETLFLKSDSALLKKDKSLPTWSGNNDDDTCSWNTRLKILFYEKTCLSFATLAEQHYKEFQYGLSLKYILLATKCQSISQNLGGSNIVQDTCLLGRAGDNYFHFSKEWEKYQKCYSKQVNTLSDDEQDIVSVIERDIQDISESCKQRNNLDILSVSNLPTNVEDAMKSSFEFYNEALKISLKDQKEELLRRIASVKNELGIKYMHDANDLYTKYWDSDSKELEESKEPMFETLAKLSLSCLMESAKIFQRVKDTTNLALLYCNIGRLMRFRAHCNLPLHSEEQRNFYSQAVDNYVQALRLVVSEKDEKIRELIKWELSTTLYVKACLLQDTPPNKDDAAAEAADALKVALRNCPTTPGPRQLLYQFRAAVINHRLASLFHNQYRDADLDVAKRKAMITLSKINYEQAVKLFLSLEETTMFLTVQLEHVALLEHQANTSIGMKLKCLQNALELMQQCEPVLLMIANKNDQPDSSDISEPSDNTEIAVRPFQDLSSCSEKLLPNNSSQLNKKVEDENQTDEDSKDDVKSEYKLLTLFNQRFLFVLKSLIQICLQKHSTLSKKECEELLPVYKAMYGATLKCNQFDIAHCTQYAKCLQETLLGFKKL